MAMDRADEPKRSVRSRTGEIDNPVGDTQLPEIYPVFLCVPCGDRLSANYPFIAIRIIACTPFQQICTPMHNSTNAIIRRIPCAVCGEIRSVMRGE